jgi:coatomer protein complex subunit epsilon
MSGTLSQTAWDTLFPVRNAFYLGNLPECQREARTLIDKKNTSLQSMPEVYFFRTLIQQGSFEQVYKGITSSSPVGLQVVKLLAQFKQAQAAGNDNKETVFASLLEFLEDAATAQDGTVRLIAAQIYLEGGDFKEALKLVHDGDTIEMFVRFDCCFNRLFTFKF